MHLCLHHRDLHLRSPFTIARSTTTVRHTTIVELSDGTMSGYGEVSDNSYYPQAAPQAVAQALTAIQPVLAKADPDHPETLHATLLALGFDSPFALSALDMAAHDLAARRAQLPLYAYWGLTWRPEKIPVSNYTLSIGPPHEVLAKAVATPWPSYKVKLGGDDDLKTIRLLRAQLPSSTQLCVDANAGWEENSAFAKTQALQALDVAFVEQPLPQGAFAKTQSLRARLGAKAIPLIADEDCQTESDVARCATAYDGVNIKLSKCGGPSAGLRMARTAHALGLRVMVGCMVESSFAIGVLRHLAPLADFVDLDGHLLIANDPGHGIAFGHDGRPTRPTEPGSGIRWRPNT